MREPRICCLDLDTFFVSVERLVDPSLRDKPVIVGARPGQRGVVLAASYEVRPLGVHSGMSTTEAARLAPHAIFIPPRQDYTSYAKRVRDILERFCPIVQTASIDEFLLDFHGCIKLYRQTQDPSPDATLLRLLHRIRENIKREIGLPASAGIGCTRVVAKIASGLAKPHRANGSPDFKGFGSGVVLVPAGRERAWLGPLPLRRFPGIGPVAEQRLLALGLHTISQLLEAEASYSAAVGEIRRQIEGAFDTETARLGRDRPAFREHDPKGLTVGSISNERTFPRDLHQYCDVEVQLMALVERVCYRARTRGVKARTVSVKLKYRDFRTVQRSQTTDASWEDRDVLQLAKRLLKVAWTRNLGLRLVGVGLSNLVGAETQLKLPFNRKDAPATQALDQVRKRFGYAAICRGRVNSSDRRRAS